MSKPVCEKKKRFHLPCSLKKSDLQICGTDCDKLEVSEPSARTKDPTCIRKILCPSYRGSLEERFPALTSSSAVDEAIYIIIALAYRDFVQSWYSEFTNDQDFVNEILLVVAHVVRNVEERLRQQHVSPAKLILDDLCGLIWRHFIDMKHAKQMLNSGYIKGLTIGDALHGIQPHPALKSLDCESTYYRLLADGILAILLPTEDLNSLCERFLIREVIGSLFLSQTVEILSQSSVIYEIIIAVSQEMNIQNIKSSPTIKSGILNDHGNRNKHQKVTIYALNLLNHLLVHYTTGPLAFISYLIPLVPRNLVASLLSEHMGKLWCANSAVQIIDIIRSIIWPDGVLAKPRGSRTRDEEDKLRCRAQQCVRDSLPSKPCPYTLHF